METVSSAQSVADFKPVHMPLNLNESANVDRFVKLFKDRFMFVPGVGWYEWDGTRWALDELGSAFSQTQAVATVLDMEMDQWLGSPAGQQAEEEEINSLRKAVSAFRTKSLGIRSRMAVLSGAEAEMGVLVGELNKNPWELVVGNGTLDLLTGGLRSSVPADRNTQTAAVVYDAAAVCPRFDAVLQHAFPGEAGESMIAYIWRVLGYTLTGSTKEQRFFFLWGKAGSGKSTICEVMRHVLGDYAVELDEEALFGGGHPTWIADLIGKRMIFKDELNQKRRVNTAVINKLVSGGTMKGRRMRKDWVDIPVHGKLFVTTNHRPPMGSAADGVYRRLQPVWFKHPVAAADKVLDYFRILGTEEGPGILRKALEGLKDYLADGLRPPAEIAEQVDDYKDAEDDFGPFMEDYLVLTGDEADWVANEDIMSMYTAWCEGMNIKPSTINEVGKHLVEAGFQRASKPIKAYHVLSGQRKAARGFRGMRVIVEDTGTLSSPVRWRPVSVAPAVVADATDSA